MSESEFVKNLIEPKIENLNSNSDFEYINYLDTSNLTKNEIFEIQKLKKGNYPSRAKRIIKKNDILISTVRPNLCHYGIIKEPYENLIASTGFTVLRTNSKINPFYLYYYLSQNIITKHLSTLADGATTSYPSITGDDILDLKINLFEKKEQEKIANILSTIDNKIELNNKINKELEEMAKDLYNFWFVQFDFPDENGKPYKSSGGKMVYNDDLKREIPDGWEVENLAKSQLTSIIDVGVEEYLENKIYLSTSEVENTEIINHENIVSYNEKPSRANMQPILNSIWFARMKDTKKIILISDFSTELVENYIFSTGFAGLNISENSLYYVWNFINNNYFEKIKNLNATGSTQKAIINDSIRNISLIIPNKELLKKFNTKTKFLYYKIYNTQRENQ